MKSQSQIIQVFLFFLIGLTLFILLGNFYNTQLFLFSGRISDADRDLLGSFVAENFVVLNSCERCDVANSTIRVQTPLNIFLNFTLTPASASTPAALIVQSQPDLKKTTIWMHNLFASFSKVSGEAFSPKPIILSLSKIQNRLGVTQ